MTGSVGEAAESATLPLRQNWSQFGDVLPEMDDKLGLQSHETQPPKLKH